MQKSIEIKTREFFKSTSQKKNVYFTENFQVSLEK